jgi:hypothetical protein
MSERTETVPATYPMPRPRRNTGRVLLLAIVVVLVAIAFVADRVAAKLATEQLQTRLVAAVDDHGVRYQSIDVNIGGFPFLTQVASGRYDAITIDMTGVQLTTSTGRTAELTSLHAVASGVNANTEEVMRGTANVVADRVDGTALVPFSTLESVIDYGDFNLSNVKFSAVDGALRATADADIEGVRIPLTAVADITVVDGQLKVALRDATAVGVPAPGPVRNYLDRLAAAQLATHLPALPFGMRLQHVAIASNGLAATATGVNVPLTR